MPYPVLDEIIHLSGCIPVGQHSSPLSSVQIVSLWPSVAFLLGRDEYSHAAICAPLSIPVATMSSQLGFPFGAAPFKMVEKYTEPNKALLQSLASDTCVLRR